MAKQGQADRFHQGTMTDGWRWFGAHPAKKRGRDGWTFRVWAPHAEAVSVVGDFNDPAKAKEIALSMYNRGADFVQHIAGASGMGVFTAAKEADRYAFGVGGNQNYIEPDYIVATALRDVNTIVYNEIKALVEGTWEPGVHISGIAEGSVGFDNTDSNVVLPDDIAAAVEDIKAKITEDGIFLEQLEKNPARFLPAENPALAPAVNIDLDQPMENVLKELSKYPVKTRLNLSGTLIVARDIAHARIKAMLDEGKPMPEYFKNHPIYYAGPAKTPKGMASGSFGPTTAGRMDPYVDLFQDHGGSMIMVAKGNRSQAVTDACKKHGGFYLGSIGGPAAILAKESIKSVEIVAFEELGMEAIRKIRVENFPAFIIVDDKGNDFFAEWSH